MLLVFFSRCKFIVLPLNLFGFYGFFIVFFFLVCVFKWVPFCNHSNFFLKQKHHIFFHDHKFYLRVYNVIQYWFEANKAKENWKGQRNKCIDACVFIYILSSLSLCVLMKPKIEQRVLQQWPKLNCSNRLLLVLSKFCIDELKGSTIFGWVVTNGEIIINKFMLTL